MPPQEIIITIVEAVLLLNGILYSLKLYYGIK